MTRPSPLRVGRIPFANLVPAFWALDRLVTPDAVRFVEGVPSALNRMLRRGRLDVSPSSSIEYAKRPDLYLLCPGISVAARDKVMSVLLLSNAPPSSLPDGPVAVTRASDTSVVLLEILLRESLGKSNRLVRTSLAPAAALRKFPAYLAIGDEAIRASLDGTARYATDLGRWWRRETGKPFVFALWIASRATAASRGDDLARFAGTLIEAGTRGLSAARGGGIEAIGPAWIPSAFRAEYWKNLSYDLDGEIDGLRLFFRLARKIGRIPAVPPLRFLEPDPPVRHAKMKNPFGGGRR